MSAEFFVKRVMEGVSGAPMLEIEPAPINRDGIPDLSEELERAIRPHLNGRDNISIRFVDQGLPTTTVAVLSAYDVKEGDLTITYDLRIMVFETATGKTGSVIHARPKARSVVLGAGMPVVGQDIQGARTYDFHEVYDDIAHARDDLDRLIRIADRHFRSHGVEAAKAADGGGQQATSAPKESGKSASTRNDEGLIDAAIANYDAASYEQLCASLKAAFESIHALSDDESIVAFYAETALAIGAAVKLATGVMIGNLSEEQKKDRDQRVSAIQDSIVVLERIIAPHLAWILRHGTAGVERTNADEQQPIQNHAKLNCALIWKGYLLARIDPQKKLGVAETYALKCMRILSTVSGAELVKMMRQLGREKKLLEAVTASDWPPPDFREIYFAHHKALSDFLPQW
jgi:hypothetical protein